MKNLKKFGALLLTLVMMLSLSVTAFAAGESYGEVVLDPSIQNEQNTITGSGTNNVTVSIKGGTLTQNASGTYPVAIQVRYPADVDSNATVYYKSSTATDWSSQSTPDGTDSAGNKWLTFGANVTAEQLAGTETVGKTWNIAWTDSQKTNGCQTVTIQVTPSSSAYTTKDYAITIANSVLGETYNAYKIFDVTYTASTGNDGTTTVSAASYTISTSSKWFETVAKYTLKEGDTYTAGQAIYSGNGLTLTQSAGDPTVYIVDGSDRAGAKLSGANFAAYLGANIPKDESDALITADGTATGTGTSVIIPVSSAGYYFVDTSLGSLCSLDTTTPSVIIYEKNTTPTIEKKVKEDDNNEYLDSAILDVNDTVHYQLKVNTGTNVNSTVTGVDGDYKIVDVLPTGFSYEANSIKIVDKLGTDGAERTWVQDTDYTLEVSQDSKTITIVLKADKTLGTLPQNTNIFITYDAKMDQTAVNYTSNPGNINNVTLTYKSQESKADASVYTYTIGSDVDGTPSILKVDGSTLDEDGKVVDATTKLAGVKFILSKDVTTGEGDTATTTTYYAQVSKIDSTKEGAYYLTGWTTEKPATGNIVTGENGGIEVKGLDAGRYTLTEVETLPGYNLLNDTIAIVIDGSGNVTYKMTSSTGDAENTIIIKNNTGTELPSTGGMGTTIFYIVGGVLVLGAAILLVTKRRMNAAK